MEITLYPKLDIRALRQPYKTFDAVAPLFSQAGNDLLIDSKTMSTYEQQIPVYCDTLTLKGKFTVSLVLHGNCDFTLESAEIYNIKQVYSTIEVADDFTGTITIKESYVHFKKTSNNTHVVQYAINQFINSDGLTQPSSVTIENSTLDGAVFKVSDLNLMGNVKLNALDYARLSILNAVRFEASSAHIKSNYMTLVSNSPQTNHLNVLEAVAGPVKLVGAWEIDQIIIVEKGKSFDSLVKIGNNKNPGNIILHSLKVDKIRANSTALTFINSEVTLSNGHFDKTKASIKDSILHVKSVQDQLDWNVLGTNALDLDKQSLTGLRTLQDKFMPLSQIQPKKVSQPSQQDIKPDLETGKDDSPKPLTNHEQLNAHKDADKSDTDDLDKNLSQDGQDAVDPATAAKKLNELIGLSSVKKTLQTYINQAKINKLRREKGLHEVKATSRHMVFMGNPGVGKTTVAKLVTGILYENGAIEKNNFVFCEVKSLIGTHLGETQKETHKKFQEAMGGVLFIDEAHTLASDDLYSQEATKQILQDSENYADRIITILAGYPEQMEDYLENGDPGLKSRFPNKINFPDYSKKELLQIFQLFMHRDHQLIDERIYKTKIFAYELLYYAGLIKSSDQPKANARSVRNFYDRLMQLRDNRLITVDNPTEEEIMTVTSKDFAKLYKEIRAKLLKK